MHKFLAFLVLIGVFIFGYWSIQKFLGQLSPSILENTVIQKVGCDEECKTEIRNEVQKSIATPTPIPKTPAPAAIPSAAKQVQFVSLSSSYSTTNTDWVDVPGTDVTFDIQKDYSKNAVVNWQATLKVADANGQAFARLFDTTHGIAVSGSEISTINNSDYKTAYSGNLNLWSGEINYRVQIKSLNSFTISYTGGKIKVEY